MTTVLLIVAALIDLALAALLVGVSGFTTGGGPESMNAGGFGTAAYWAAVVVCVAAPVAGFIFNKRVKAAAGLIVAWLPARWRRCCCPRRTERTPRRYARDPISLTGTRIGLAPHEPLLLGDDVSLCLQFGCLRIWRFRGDSGGYGICRV